jgi:hypothetical protein
MKALSTSMMKTFAVLTGADLHPRHPSNQTLFRFATRSGDFGVHVGTVGATVDQRSAQVDQFDERAFESWPVNVFLKSQHRGADARGNRRNVDSSLHRCSFSRINGDLDQLPADPMEHRLESVVRSELLVDVVKVIPKRLGTYSELSGDVPGVLTFRKAAEHAMFLVWQRVHRSWPRRVVWQLYDLSRHMKHLPGEGFSSLAAVHVAR